MVKTDYYVGVVLTLSICYTLIFGYCMYKTNKFGYFNNEWRHTKLFYYSVIIQTFIRMTTYALLTFAVTKAQRELTFILVMRSVPDTLFFINYVLLVYQTVNIFYHSHMENRLHISLLKHFTRPKFRTARKLLSLLSFSWLAFMGVLYALLLLNKVTGSQIDLEFTIVNLLSGTLVLLYLMYLYSKYSETPFKSVQDQKNLKIVSRVLMTWTLGRYFKGILGLIDFKSTKIFINMSDPQKSDIGNSLLFISENIIADILCFYIVMDSRFINIFISQDVENMKKLENKNRQTINEIIYKDNSQVFIEKSELKIGNTFKKKKNGLGEIFHCEFGKASCLYRKISFSRVTEFTAEEIKKELEDFKEKNMNGLVHFYGATLEYPNIGIITEAPGRSLFKLLHEDKVILALREKMRILREIGFILKAMHKKEFFHGHLSSHNIILSDSYEPAIADFGIFTLKKYAGLMAGYCNKNQWTSPELWTENEPTSINPSPSDDVYTFGILIHEVITGDIPLENLRSQNYKEEIGTNRRSPRIPVYFPKGLKKILELCWCPVSERKGIELIYSKLADFKFKGLQSDKT